MDRQARRLYRQRGSHLRKTVDDDNVLVIRTPLRQINNGNNDVAITTNNNSFSSNFNPLINENYNLEKTPILQHNIFDDNDWDLIDAHDSPTSINSMKLNEISHIENLQIANDIERDIKRRRIDNDIYNSMKKGIENNFNISTKDLPFNKNSFIAINALNFTLNYIFDNNLLKKAKFDLSNLSNKDTLHSNTINLNKLLYELDISIFINLINGINKDLVDILDINMANNQLYLNWKSKLRQNKKLNLNLINLNNILNNLNTNLNNQLDNHLSGSNIEDTNSNSNDPNEQDLPSLKNDNIKLNKLIDLNDSLFNLTNEIKENKQKFIAKSIDTTNINPINFHEKNQTTISDNKFLINQFCNLVDPYDGLLAKIKEVNKKAKNLESDNI